MKLLLVQVVYVTVALVFYCNLLLFNLFVLSKKDFLSVPAMQFCAVLPSDFCISISSEKVSLILLPFITENLHSPFDLLNTCF